MCNYWDQFDETDEMFWLGVAQGIIAFAYWKDGVQYVGATGRTLEAALEEIEKKQYEAAKVRAKERIERLNDPTKPFSA